MERDQRLICREASHLIDARDLGRLRRPWLATVVIAAVLVVLGMLGYMVVIELGTHHELVRSEGISSCFDYPRMSKPLSDDYYWAARVPALVSIAAGILLVSPASAYVLYVLVGFERFHRGRARLVDRKLERALAAVPTGTGCEGQPVRVRGRVVAAAGFTTGGGLPHAVVASYLGTVGAFGRGAGRTRGRWELHAVDFTLLLDDGGEVGVRVAGGTLLPRPWRLDRRLLESRPIWARLLSDGCAAVAYQERAVTPGDEVEVSGVLSSEIDPTMEAGPRGVRLRRLIVSDPSCRLTIGLLRWMEAPPAPDRHARSR
jgi:hypothetical protein